MFNKTNNNILHLWVSLSSLFLALILTLTIPVALKFLPLKLPLFYSLSWGEEQLATPEQIFIIPAIISLITLLNLTISWQLHPSQVFFKKILIFSSLITSLILIITFTKIMLIFL